MCKFWNSPWGSRIPVRRRAKWLPVELGEYANVCPQTTRSYSLAPSTMPPAEEGTADQKTHKPKRRVGEPSPRRDQVGTVLPEEEAPHCSFSGSIKLEAARWLEATVQEVQCSMCGSVSKAKLKGPSVMIVPHPPRKSRPVRNVTRWMEQGTGWILVQKKV